ncbi:MAG: Succinylglutamate desuccinylase / Aspartoacylase family protein [Methanobacterium sp. PtaU1.Bin242]|nr:MAG: Succinylglutamate desuccinylase / Aspartoacylase family protein [Methanobacterium sp. PtaU1.Bin242]
MGSAVKIRIISPETAGNIHKNKIIIENIPDGHLTEKILEAALKGTPLINMGNGSPKVILTAGIHGNELPPQIAALQMIEHLKDKDLNGSVFMLPFAIPYATMKSSRRFKGFDMNRKASSEGYITNKIIKAVKSLKICSLADFHATKPHSNPGVESIFCSKKPCNKSFKIAEHINRAISSKIICHDNAGTLYTGALEDECNLSGIPAVTCEVVSHNNKIDPGSHERSYLQMKAYLDYFNILNSD